MFCKQCGAQIADDSKVCPYCGAQLAAGSGNGAKQAGDFVNDMMNTEDLSNQFDPADIEQNKVLSVIAYLWFLSIVTMLAAPNSKYARFHANQGLVLAIAETVVGAVVGVIGVVLGLIPFIGAIIAALLSLVISLAGLGLTIFGIVNVVNGKAKKLPLIGNITLLK